MNVWDLNANWQRLEEQLILDAGEITETTDAFMAEMLAEGPAAMEQAGWTKLSLRNRIAVAKSRIEALRGTIEAAERAEERLDAALVKAVESFGKQKFPEFSLFTTTREKASYAPKPGVDLIDLPAEFLRFREPELQIRALEEARKAGALPVGIDVVVNESTSVTLRTAAKKTEPTQTNAA